MSGQTLNDRLTAARHTLAGQGLARVVCKATTEEVIGPKKKHLDYLLHCTNEPNVSIPQLANLLIERTQHASWVVVFKALITVHHLMCYGNERFTQYLASSNCNFQLSNFLDKSSVQSAYDMSTFIRRYAKYLNEKALSYRTVAFDFCKVKRGKDDGMLRTMNTDKLLKTLPALQGQLDALLEFDCTSNDLTNGVINSSFMLLFRDLIRLFACYNDGIINLLEKYFDMNKKNCREALDIYKKFLIRMDRVAEFLKVAENVGIDKGDIPDLTKAPSSLLDALEQHLNALEGKKGATTTSAATRSTNLKNAVSALSSTSSAFGNAANGATNTSEVNGIRLDDAVARKALEEEAAVMNQLKLEDDSSQIKWEQPAWDDVERRMREVQGSDGVTTKTNPFLPSPTPESRGAAIGGGASSSSGDGLVDLFSSPMGQNNNQNAANTKASDDLLCLSGNPFADSLFGGGGNASPPQLQQQAPTSTGANFGMHFGTNGFGGAPAVSQGGAGTFASDASFAAVFGSSNDTSPTLVYSLSQAAQGFATSKAPPSGGAFDAFGDVLQPTSSLTGGAAKTMNGTTEAKSVKGAGATTGLIKGDLDSSLASLAQNLDINGPKQSLKKGAGGHQWGSPKVSAKTGGTSWGPGGGPPPPGAVLGVAAAAPPANWAGASQQFAVAPAAVPGGAQWGATPGGMMAGPFPTQTTPGIMPNPGGFGMRGMAAPGGMAMGGGIMGGGQMSSSQPPSNAPPNLFGSPPVAPAGGNVNDPFGAL